jgi:hypothetical protein
MKGVKVSFFFINNNWQASSDFPVQAFFDNRLQDGVVTSLHKKKFIDLSEN